jgi:hypothetical protein
LRRRRRFDLWTPSGELVSVELQIEVSLDVSAIAWPPIAADFVANAGIMQGAAGFQGSDADPNSIVGTVSLGIPADQAVFEDFMGIAQRTIQGLPLRSRDSAEAFVYRRLQRINDAGPHLAALEAKGGFRLCSAASDYTTGRLLLLKLQSIAESGDCSGFVSARRSARISCVQLAARLWWGRSA